MKFDFFITAYTEHPKLDASDELSLLTGLQSFDGWFWIKDNPKAIEALFSLSAEHNITLYCQAKITLTKNEDEMVNHYVLMPKQNLKMSERNSDDLFGILKCMEEQDKGGYGRILLPDKLSIDFPVEVEEDRIYRLSEYFGELVASEKLVKRLTDGGASLNESAVVGKSKIGQNVYLLKTDKFTPPVELDDSISDRLGIDKEAEQIQSRYLQSGLLSYRNLDPDVKFLRMCDPLGLNNSPDWIVSSRTADELKEIGPRRYSFYPILDVGSDLHTLYHEKWAPIMSAAKANSNNSISLH